MNTDDTKARAELSDRAVNLADSLSNVIYDFAFGMTRLNFRLNREIAALIDTCGYFTPEAAELAKGEITEALRAGGEIENILADVLSRSTEEDRDEFLRRLSDAAVRGVSEAQTPPEGLAPEDGAVRTGGEPPNGSEDGAISGAAVGAALGGIPGAAAGAALGAEAELLGKVEEAADTAAEAPERAQDEAGAEAKEKARGAIRSFLGSIKSGTVRAATAVKDGFVASGSYVAAKASAAGAWMDGKPVLRQISAAIRWVGRMIALGASKVSAGAARSWNWTKPSRVFVHQRVWLPLKRGLKLVGKVVLWVLAIVGAICVAAAALMVSDPEFRRAASDYQAAAA